MKERTSGLGRKLLVSLLALAVGAGVLFGVLLCSAPHAGTLASAAELAAGEDTTRTLIATAAQREYRESYRELTGKDADESDPLVKASLDAIAAAVENADRDLYDAAVDKLSAELDALCSSLIRRNDVFVRDSEETVAIVEAARKTIHTAILDVFERGEEDVIPDFSLALKGFAARLEAQRLSERTAAKAEVEAKIGSTSYSPELQAKLDALSVAVNEKIDSADYCELALLIEKFGAQADLLAVYAELDALASADGIDLTAVREEVYATLDAIDAARYSNEIKNLLGDETLKAQRGYALTALESLVAGGSEAVCGLLDGPNGFRARAEGAREKTVLFDLVAEAKVAVAAEKFLDKNEVLRKSFESITAEDKDSITKAQRNASTLAEDVRAYLEIAPYGSLESKLSDYANKASFEAAKAAALADAETVLLKNDDPYVRETYEAKLVLLEEVDYTAQTEDAGRSEHLQDCKTQLQNALSSLRRATTLARTVLERSSDTTELYNDLAARGGYSEEQLATLRAISEKFASDARDILKNKENGEGGKTAQELLQELYSEAVAKMKAVPVSEISGGDLSSDYDEDFDGTTLWGSVENSELPSGVKLSIEVKENKSSESIDKAARDGKLSVADGSTLNEADLKDMVYGKQVVMTFDVTLSKDGAAYTQSGLCTIRVLLPEELRGREDLTVVYEGENGFEVYETKVEDGKYLVFTTSHFSEFVVLGGEATDMWWLVITLTAVLVAELAVLLVVLVKRGSKKTAASVLPLGLLGISTNIVTVSVVLGVAIVAVGALLILLLCKKRK